MPRNIPNQSVLIQLRGSSYTILSADLVNDCPRLPEQQADIRNILFKFQVDHLLLAIHARLH